VREILITLGSGGWLADGTIATVERGSRGGAFAWPAGFQALRERRYGEATLWYGRAATGEADRTTVPTVLSDE
jgi:16S rRNA (guanine966-N2)-methyltransferase